MPDGTAKNLFDAKPANDLLPILRICGECTSDELSPFDSHLHPAFVILRAAQKALTSRNQLYSCLMVTHRNKDSEQM